MPRIHLCFVWHMHQPFYKNLVSGEYRLPWVRLHALKDYYGMVKILDEFPGIHQTFNLVPSLLVQLEDYANGQARDPFLNAALKPAEELSRSEREFILSYFFQANQDRVIRRFPRYAELFDVVARFDHNAQRAGAYFNAGEMRDLQVLSQLAWFDEYDLEGDPEVAQLVKKGREYTLPDQQLVGRKEAEALGRVIGAYRAAASRGQIELSASPFYHPILPLLCDSNIAHTSHPYVPLPTQFAYPGDALEQMRRSREYMRERFGARPAGLWPSEGGVSEETLELAAESGYSWTAADTTILERSLNGEGGLAGACSAYRWERGGRGIDVIFRNRRLSDLVALAYSNMPAEEAAVHFVHELKRQCAGPLEAGQDALTPIILDGENAWENYLQNGRRFLRALYREISQDPNIMALTVSEALKGRERKPLSRLYPGSWIDANFDIWVGDRDDNLAWEFLLTARQRFDEAVAAGRLTEEARAAAYEEILIAEGSDWCWWYGPENPSANQAEFDQLFRDHLANVYRLMGEGVPQELLQPIGHAATKPQHEPPSGLIQPVVDGVLTSSREWENAGRYSLDPRARTLHGKRALLDSLRYGSDGQNLYVRVDVTERVSESPALQFILKLRTAAGQFELRCDCAGALSEPELPAGAVQVAAEEIFEGRISMSALHVRLGDPVHLRFEILRDGLPLAAIPLEGEIAVQTGNLAAYAY